MDAKVASSVPFAICAHQVWDPARLSHQLALITYIKSKETWCVYIHICIYIRIWDIYIYLHIYVYTVYSCTHTFSKSKIRDEQCKTTNFCDSLAMLDPVNRLVESATWPLLVFLLRGEDPPQEGPETAKEVEQEAVGGTYPCRRCTWWCFIFLLFFSTFSKKRSF